MLDVQLFNPCNRCNPWLNFCIFFSFFFSVFSVFRGSLFSFSPLAGCHLSVFQRGALYLLFNLIFSLFLIGEICVICGLFFLLSFLIFVSFVLLIRRSTFDVECSMFSSSSFFRQYEISSHAPFFAESSTASHTNCVFSASRNVGEVGLPLARFSRKSAI